MEFNATFLVSAISFILFTIIMNKIFYKPLEKIMTERRNFIDNTLSDAKYSSEKADAILKDRDEKLHAALLQSKQIISDSANNAKLDAETKIKDAKQKMRLEITNAKNELSVQADELDENLKPEVKKLAGMISSKLLGTGINTEDY